MFGKVNFAVSLRSMAGGSDIDLVPLFEVSTDHLHNTFEDFLGWVLLSFKFPLMRWLREQNCEALRCLANRFAEKTNGVFHGPFGALDGLAVRLHCPHLTEAPDHVNCCRCKGFHALHVQAICDGDNRFL